MRKPRDAAAGGARAVRGALWLELPGLTAEQQQKRERQMPPERRGLTGVEAAAAGNAFGLPHCAGTRRRWSGLWRRSRDHRKELAQASCDEAVAAMPLLARCRWRFHCRGHRRGAQRCRARGPLVGHDDAAVAGRHQAIAKVELDGVTPVGRRPLVVSGQGRRDPSWLWHWLQLFAMIGATTLGVARALRRCTRWAAACRRRGASTSSLQPRAREGGEHARRQRAARADFRLVLELAPCPSGPAGGGIVLENSATEAGDR